MGKVIKRKPCTIELDEKSNDFFKSDYLKYKSGNPVKSVAIKQKRTTEYTGSIGSSLQTNRFAKQIDTGANRTEKGTFVAFYEVPEDMSIEDIRAAFAQDKGGCVWQMLSNDVTDVMTSEQLNILAAGKRTLDEWEESLSVKDKNGDVVTSKSGAVVYSQKFYSETHKEDIDMRGVVNISVSAETVTGVSESHPDIAAEKPAKKDKKKKKDKKAKA